LPDCSSVSYIRALSLHELHANQIAKIISATTNHPNVVLIPYTNIPIVARIDEVINDAFLPRLSLMYPVGISHKTIATEKIDCRSVMCESVRPCEV
jgi:hypothetical protein